MKLIAKLKKGTKICGIVVENNVGSLVYIDRNMWAVSWSEFENAKISLKTGRITSDRTIPTYNYDKYMSDNDIFIFNKGKLIIYSLFSNKGEHYSLAQSISPVRSSAVFKGFYTYADAVQYTSRQLLTDYKVATRCIDLCDKKVLDLTDYSKSSVYLLAKLAYESGKLGKRCVLPRVTGTPSEGFNILIYPNFSPKEMYFYLNGSSSARTLISGLKKSENLILISGVESISQIRDL